MRLVQLLRLDGGEVGLGHLGQLDVRQHDLPRHLVNVDADALVLLVQVLNLDGVFLFNLLLRLDQIVDVLFELADPDLLLVPAAMAEVVPHDAVLSVADKLFLGLFVQRVENDHSEG